MVWATQFLYKQQIIKLRADQ